MTTAPLRYTVDPFLVNRYNRPGPRYTSYPTAPLFDDAFGPEAYAEAIRASDAAPQPPDLSLYFHLPFCRALCFYCGCHMLVTHRPEKIDHYLGYLAREVGMVAPLVSPERRVRQLHWGGGTPTYLTPEQIGRLMDLTRRAFTLADDAEVSLEADPRGLDAARLQAARDHGFNRISIGVQDFAADVQQAIGRIQPYALVAETVAHSRALGFEGINFDLIYGLPHQTEASFRETLRQVIALGPDRISLFSYAHVPWLKKHQSLVPTEALPDAETKLRIFTQAIEQLTGEGGYRYIGMDHFARPSDSLCRAQDAGTLYRNFQGYTTHAGSDILAFGMSAISQVTSAYAQNVKELGAYYAALDAGRLPTQRGIRLTGDDQLRRHVITRLMCDFSLNKQAVEDAFHIDFEAYFGDALEGLSALAADGLVRLEERRIEVTDVGRLLIRNIAMLFDAYLDRAPEARPRFSQTV